MLFLILYCSEYDTINAKEEYTAFMTTTVSTSDGSCNRSAAWASAGCEQWCPQVSDTNPVWHVDLARLFYLTALGIASSQLDWFNVQYSINGNDWIDTYQVCFKYINIIGALNPVL